jgi:hypothetical protein
LKLLLNTLPLRPHLIAITEVKYKNLRTFNTCELNLDGYTFFTNDFDVNNRGVLIYVDNTLESNLLEMDCNHKEHIFVTLKCKNSIKLTVGNIYRSPSSNSDDDQLLYDLINSLSRSSTEKLLLIGETTLTSGT